MDYNKISGFSDEIDSDLELQLKGVKELGLDYISIRGVGNKSIGDFDPESFKEEIAPLLEKNSVKISSIGSPIGKIAIDDEEAMEKQLKILDNLCKICNLTGCDYIRMFSFYMPKGEDPDNYKDEVLRKLDAFIDIAKKYNVCLLHENEKDIYGDSPERCLVLAQKLFSDNFALIFDFANFVQVGADTIAAYKLLEKYLRYIHIKDAVYANDQNVPCGTGDGKIEEILKDLFSKGYDGFLTLEPHLVKFDSLQSLELEAAEDVIQEDLAESGFAGFKMQLDGLKKILANI